MTYCMIISTTANADDAKKIAYGLIENKLAACTNIVSGVTSIYLWQDKVCEDTECLVLIKTQRNLFDKVKDFIVKNHPYTLPEVIMLPIENGLDGYLSWVKENTL